MSAQLLAMKQAEKAADLEGRRRRVRMWKRAAYRLCAVIWLTAGTGLYVRIYGLLLPIFYRWLSIQQDPARTVGPVIDYILFLASAAPCAYVAMTLIRLAEETPKSHG